MSLFYEVSYRLGFHPWEDLAGHPPFADQLLSLVAREEHGVDRRTDEHWTSAAEARSGESNWRNVGGRSPAWTTSAEPSTAPRNASVTPVSRWPSSSAT